MYGCIFIYYWSVAKFRYSLIIYVGEQGTSLIGKAVIINSNRVTLWICWYIFHSNDLRWYVLCIRFWYSVITIIIKVSDFEKSLMKKYKYQNYGSNIYDLIVTEFIIWKKRLLKFSLGEFSLEKRQKLYYQFLVLKF